MNSSADARRRVLDHGDVPPGHGSRHGTGADSEPRQPGGRPRLPLSRAPDRPGDTEALARSHDGRVPHFARRALRLAVPAQLRRHPDPGRARAAARRGRRARVRLGRLRDAAVARSGQDRGARHDRRRRAERGARAERRSRGRPDRRPAGAARAREFSYILNARGRLQTEEEFGSDRRSRPATTGDVVYLRDVARIELGPETYALRSMLDGRACRRHSGLPAARRERARAVRCGARTMAELVAATFPKA